MNRKHFTKEFKLAILQELESGKTAAQIGSEHDIKDDLIWNWKREYNKDPQHAFAGKGNYVKEEARNAALERKIGQQTMEIDFLKRVNANLQEHLVESKKNARSKT